jgi:hypothetical protein
LKAKDIKRRLAIVGDSRIAQHGLRRLDLGIGIHKLDTQRHGFINIDGLGLQVQGENSKQQSVEILFHDM